MARVFKRRRADGTLLDGWHASWTSADGRKVTRKAGRTRRSAEAFLAQRLNEVEQARLHPGFGEGDGRTPLRDFVKTYGERSADRLRTGRERMRQLERWCEHFGAGARLMDVRPESIDAFRRAQRDAGLGPATTNRLLAALKALLGRAVAWGYLGTNVATRVPLEREENHRERYLTLEECAALVAAAPPRLRSLIILAMNTGARRGELLALRWRDVNLREPSITFRHTKARRTRRVPINETTVRELKRLQRRCLSGADDPVLQWDGRPLRYHRRAFMKACREAGIEGACFHSLRHSWASHLAQGGVDLFVLQRLGGWQSLDMVQRYAHLASDQLRDAARSVDLGVPDLRLVKSAETIGKHRDGSEDTARDDPPPK